jgi:hypothetical protein
MRESTTQLTSTARRETLIHGVGSVGMPFPAAPIGRRAVTAIADGNRDADRKLRYGYGPLQR